MIEPRSPEQAPCAGCAELISREHLQPYCRLATQYGQIGCRRKSARPPSWTGATEPRARRRKPRLP